MEGLDFVQAAKEWGRGAECVADGGQYEVEVNSFHTFTVAMTTHVLLLPLAGPLHISRSIHLFDQPRALFPLLQHAIRTHARRTREAATGRGIDRHLLGLKLMLEDLPVDASTSASSESSSSSSPTDPPQQRTHPLFTDPLFSRSQEWRLSTSGLSAGDQFRGTGFGAGWEDGYGINCKFDSSLSELYFGIFEA